MEQLGQNLLTPYLDRFCSFPSSYMFCHQVINFVARCALMCLKPSDSQLITNTQIIHSIYMSKKKERKKKKKANRLDFPYLTHSI